MINTFRLLRIVDLPNLPKSLSKQVLKFVSILMWILEKDFMISLHLINFT